MAETNPLLNPAFEIPFDRIRAEHVEPAVDALIEDARARLGAIGAQEGTPTYASTLHALEEATRPLEWAMGIVGHLESVKTTSELRSAYNAVQPKVSAFFTGIPLDPALWKVLKAFAATEEAGALDATRARFLEKTLEEFKRHGADLDDAGKKRLEALDVELATLTTRFAEHVLDATNDWELLVTDEAKLSGLPEGAKAAARESAELKGKEGFRFTLQAPSFIPLMTYLDDGGVREQAWRAYNTRATRGERDNRPLITKILRLRREKARLLGYADFADLVLEDRMAKTGAEARRFVSELRRLTERFFAEEREALEAFFREHGEGAETLSPWDVAYWAEKQRKARYDFDDEALRPYFPADRVVDGLFETVRRLYGVTFQPRADLPTWDPLVKAYAIEDADGTFLGAFYVDLYPREDKRGGAWMNQLHTGAGNEPHLGLICANVQPPVGERPALLNHDEVETLFHEFGHLMHLLLSKVDVRSLAGTHVAWDFVELPSQIMENWTWEREALDLFARHVDTGEPIPDDLYEKMVRARNYRAATGMMRQLGFAAVDLALHVDYDEVEDGDVMVYARRILQAYAPAELPPDYGMIAGFLHLFSDPVGYAAGYYSYKWAEALDADAFTRFKEEGVFSPEAGRAFREAILSRGDSEEPSVLFKDFMGREPSLEPLLERSGLLAE